MALQGKWRQHAINIARQEKIPVNVFLSLVDHESGGRPNARSPAGAIGFTQLMPGTAAGLGVDPYKPLENLRGGARYLKQQIDRFGKVDLALAAYNAGPGRVEDGSWRSIRETSNYVSNIMGSLGRYHVTASSSATPDPVEATPPARGLPPPPKLIESDLTSNLMASLNKISMGEDPTQALTDVTAANTETMAQTEKLNEAAVAAYKAQVAAAPEPATTTTGPSAGQPADLTPTSNRWGGAESVARQIAKMGWDSGLTTVSEKRDRKSTASGGVSDHWTGSKNAYAFDLSNGSHPTPEMDAAAKRILSNLGFNWNGKSPVVVTKRVGDFRIQVLYRTQVGGNHNNHIHVGVRRA
jgi:Transglycosylase SLT domain